MRTYDTTWITLSAISRRLGVSRKIARKQLERVRFVFPSRGTPPRWDSRVLDLIDALHGRPHRTLQPAHQDWLSAYLKESHARTEARSVTGT